MEMIADSGRTGFAGHHGTQTGDRTTQPHRAVRVDLVESLFGKSTLMPRLDCLPT
jgi:hypothetical protein